jgi:PAS domain-containing protein
MDYHVGSSPSPEMPQDNETQAGFSQAETSMAEANNNSNMFDMASFDLPQNNILDQLAASIGLTFQDMAAVAAGQQPYYVDPQQQQQQQQQQGYATFAQPATAALQTMGQHPTSVISMESANNSNASIQQQQQQQQQQCILPVQQLQALAPQTVVSSATMPPGYPTTAPYSTNVPASVVSMSTMATQNDEDEQDLIQKRPAHWDKMSSEEQRRWERNMREQQRSHRISAQIKLLRTVLTESNVPFKPNKYSILQSVAEYIKQLQARAIMLDAEHSKLIETIRQTSEMVNSGTTPPLDAPVSTTPKQDDADVTSDADMLFVQGLDYRICFEQCTAPLGIAALDGRILAVNDEFQSVLGYSREELLKHTLFTVMQNHEEVYKAMGEMLKAEDDSIDRDLVVGTRQEKPAMNWSGIVGQTKNHKLCASITLTRSGDGTPKFFNCALMVT